METPKPKIALAQLIALLSIEREEEQAQFEAEVASLTLPEKREKGVCWHPLAIVGSGYGLGDYAFVIVERTKDLNTPHRFRAGNIVRLFNARYETAAKPKKGFDEDAKPHEKAKAKAREAAKDSEEKGVIDYLDKNRMKIVLYAKDLPEWLGEGSIGVDLLFDDRSYREMEYAVRDVMNAENNRLAELRETLLGDRVAEQHRPQDVFVPSVAFLNPSQNEAIQQIVLAKDVAIVHGPPGTGKTTTVVQAVRILTELHRSRTILVCAPSNAATDLLTERIAAQGIYVTRIGNLSRIDEDIIKHSLEHQLAEHPDTKNIKKVRLEAAQARREAQRFRRSFGAGEREDRKSLFQEAAALSAWAKDLEDKLVEEILTNSQVITCTLTGTANSIFKGRTFDTVVIDEAAQALEAATWIPMRMARRVVLAGDPLQLPPTVKSAEAQRGGLSVTLLEKGIAKHERQVRQKGAPFPVALLDVQYRMHRLIMGFSNSWFYGSRLSAHPSVAEHTLEVGNKEPLIYIDTAGCGFAEQQPPEQSSRFNPDEFGIIREHLYQLLDDFAFLPPPTVGIISPYKEQVNYITQSLRDDERLADIKEIEVNTIDGFQGQECDVIYISLVRSNERAEIGFLSDFRRMNVALTRARKKLIVVGDSGTLGSHRFYQTFIEYCEANDAYHSAWEWMS